MIKNRWIVTKNGKPFRAYQELGIALLVMDLCEDLSPSNLWDIRLEGSDDLTI